MLFEESGISPEIVAERGYRTAVRRADVPNEFPSWQCRRGLVIPMYSPDGETVCHQVRPDKPILRKDGSAPKYETSSGSPRIIDVHPSMRERVCGGDEPLWATEGAKTGDANTSRDLPTIVLAGVWGWVVPKVRPYQLLPCFDHVRLKGRVVNVAFDSDVMTKPEVQQALEAFAEALEARGADVRVVYLPDAADGRKQGLDDFYAAGGTVAELKALTRRLEPEDLGRVRLSRDAKLKALVEDLGRTLWSRRWKGMGGHSARDVFEELVCAAARCGKPYGEGIRVKVSWRTLQERASIGSSRTLSKSIGRLEEWGLVYRDNEGRKAEKTGAFVLRASVKQVGGTGAGEEKGSNPQRGSDPGALHLRAPRLRWSDPGRKARRGTVKGTRRVRETRLPARPPRKRLGKIRGAVIDALDVAGGELPLRELYDVLKPGMSPEKKRPRDLRRRQLPMLERAGIITVDEDLVVRLTDDWLEALENARDLGGELEAEEVARKRHRIQREAFRDPRWDRVSRHPVNAGGDAWLEELEVLPEPPSTAVLYDLMHRQIPVGTPRGDGLLWQVFSDQVGVVVDSEPDRVSFFDPAELLVIDGAA